MNINSFFEYTLNGDITEDELHNILMFLSQQRISEYCKEYYNLYRKAHPDAKEIDFLADKEIIEYLQLPKLEDWDEPRLIELLRLLKEEKVGNQSFVDPKTTAEDFLFAFGATEEISDDYKPINWTGDYRNKGPKKQILDLLCLMGYKLDDLRLKKKFGEMLDSVFNIEFKPNDFPQKNATTVESVAHDQLQKIIVKAKEQ